MKKNIVISIVFILILSLCNIANAYSTSLFSIDIPESWESDATDSFVNENGDNVNVQVTTSAFGTGNPYTQANLDMLVDEIYNNMDSYRDEIAKSLKESYGEYISESEIKEYVDSFKCDSVDLSEITTCTKNNYKCFHLISKYSMEDYSYYCNQYSIVSENNIFTLTVSTEEKEDFENSELKGIVDSFTINNYKEPKDSGLSATTIGIIAGACASAVVGIVSYTKNKKNDNNL